MVNTVVRFGPFLRTYVVYGIIEVSINNSNGWLSF